jgi:hypothetical protein
MIHKIANLYIIVTFSLLLGIVGVAYSYHEFFYSSPNIANVMYALFDFFLSGTVILLIFRVIPSNTLEQAFELIESNYLTVIKKLKYLIVILSLWSIYQAYNSIGLIILGAVRQDLILEHGTMGVDYLIVSSFFKVLVPFAILIKSNNILRVMIVIGFFATMFITGSRNELTYAGYMIAVIAIFHKDKIVLLKLFYVFLAFLSFALFITIFAQGRPVAEGVLGVKDVLEKHFFYRAYSIHLADYSIAIAGNFEKLFYPLFGYPFEWLLNKLNFLIYPVGSGFISEYHFIGFDAIKGNHFFANVAYPWWSWFVGTYGPMGLVIKALYSFFLIVTFIKYRLWITNVYFITYVLFMGQGGTFLLTLNSVIVLFICVLFDFIGRKNYAVRK